MVPGAFLPFRLDPSGSFKRANQIFTPPSLSAWLSGCQKEDIRLLAEAPGGRKEGTTQTEGVHGICWLGAYQSFC